MGWRPVWQQRLTGSLQGVLWLRTFLVGGLDKVRTDSYRFVPNGYGRVRPSIWESWLVAMEKLRAEVSLEAV